MKLKHVAAFVMLLLAVGCTQQPAAPVADSGVSSEPAATSSTVAPETDVLATKTVSFNVTGMK